MTTTSRETSAAEAASGEEAILAGLLRRILTTEDEVYVDIRGSVCIIDGSIVVTDEEKSLIQGLRTDDEG
jgi:hypothetical protein